MVPSSREALARLADAYHGHPSRRLTVVGITGTNGKTTTSLLVEALLARGRPSRTGVIGTIQYRVGVGPGRRARPRRSRSSSRLCSREMVEAGVGGAAMEVSSHALALSRVDGIEFDVAVFTNLTQDHLDFHRRSRPTATPRPGSSPCSRPAPSRAAPRW